MTDRQRLLFPPASPAKSDQKQIAAVVRRKDRPVLGMLLLPLQLCLTRSVVDFQSKLDKRLRILWPIFAELCVDFLGQRKKIGRQSAISEVQVELQHNRQKERYRGTGWRSARRDK